jgi:hypothetical protein
MRKPCGVAPHLLVEPLRADAVERGKVGVQQDLAPPHEQDSVLDTLERDTST